MVELCRYHHKPLQCRDGYTCRYAHTLSEILLNHNQLINYRSLLLLPPNNNNNNNTTTTRRQLRKRFMEPHEHRDDRIQAANHWWSHHRRDWIQFTKKAAMLRRGTVGHLSRGVMTEGAMGRRRRRGGERGSGGAEEGWAMGPKVAGASRHVLLCERSSGRVYLIGRDGEAIRVDGATVGKARGFILDTEVITIADGVVLILASDVLSVDPFIDLGDGGGGDDDGGSNDAVTLDQMEMHQNEAFKCERRLVIAATPSRLLDRRRLLHHLVNSLHLKGLFVKPLYPLDRLTIRRSFYDDYLHRRLMYPTEGLTFSPLVGYDWRDGRDTRMINPLFEWRPKETMTIVVRLGVRLASCPRRGCLFEPYLISPFRCGRSSSSAAGGYAGMTPMMMGLKQRRQFHDRQRQHQSPATTTSSSPHRHSPFIIFSTLHRMGIIHPVDQSTINQYLAGSRGPLLILRNVNSNDMSWVDPPNTFLNFGGSFTPFRCVICTVELINNTKWICPRCGDLYRPGLYLLSLLKTTTTGAVMRGATHNDGDDDGYDDDDDWRVCFYAIETVSNAKLWIPHAASEFAAHQIVEVSFNAFGDNKPTDDDDDVSDDSSLEDTTRLRYRYVHDGRAPHPHGHVKRHADCFEDAITTLGYQLDELNLEDLIFRRDDKHRTTTISPTTAAATMNDSVGVSKRCRLGRKREITTTTMPSSSSVCLTPVHRRVYQCLYRVFVDERIIDVCGGVFRAARRRNEGVYITTKTTTNGTVELYDGNDVRIGIPDSQDDRSYPEVDVVFMDATMHQSPKELYQMVKLLMPFVRRGGRCILTMMNVDVLPRDEPLKVTTTDGCSSSSTVEFQVERRRQGDDVRIDLSSSSSRGSRMTRSIGLFDKNGVKSVFQDAGMDYYTSYSFDQLLSLINSDITTDDERLISSLYETYLFQKPSFATNNNNNDLACNNDNETSPLSLTMTRTLQTSLPECIENELLPYLELFDLVRIRRVSKQWRRVVDTMRLLPDNDDDDDDNDNSLSKYFGDRLRRSLVTFRSLGYGKGCGDDELVWGDVGYFVRLGGMVRDDNGGGGGDYENETDEEEELCDDADWYDDDWDDSFYDGWD